MAQSKPPKAGTMKQVLLAELKLYPGNARRGDVDAIAASLEAHGQYKPIVANARAGSAFGDGTILAGNHTYQAAEKLGWPKLRVFYVDVDDDQAAQINLIDNRTNDLAGYDTEALVAQLQALPGLEATGYDEDSLQGLLSELTDEPTAGERDPDDVPAIAPSRVDPGDLWQLGDHFLICGDAGDPATVTALMGEDRAALVWTDPPTMRQDVKVDDYFGMVAAALDHAVDVSIEGAPIYLCHPSWLAGAFEVALEQGGWEYSQTLVWVRDTLSRGGGDYQVQHEPILYGAKPGAQRRWYGGVEVSAVDDQEPDVVALNKQSLRDLIRELRNDRGADVVREEKAVSAAHATIKPVPLVLRHLQNSSLKGEVVLDVFAGSGTTAIAAESLGRKARLVELEPSHCDLILTRWEQFTGRKAKIRKTR